MDSKRLLFKILGLGDPEAETAELANRHNVDHNALAHAYTMAKVLHKYGPKFAEQLGLNNEIGSNLIASLKDTQNTRYPDAFGDLWNNEIGRQIAEFGIANGLSFEELEPYLIAAVRQGRTINDKSRDPGVPSFAPLHRSDGTFSRLNPVWEYYQHHADKPRWIPPAGTEPNLGRPVLDRQWRNGSPARPPSRLGAARRRRRSAYGLIGSPEAFPSQRATYQRGTYGDPSRLHERFLTGSRASSMPDNLPVDWPQSTWRPKVNRGRGGQNTGVDGLFGPMHAAPVKRSGR